MSKFKIIIDDSLSISHVPFKLVLLPNASDLQFLLAQLSILPFGLWGDTVCAEFPIATKDEYIQLVLEKTDIGLLEENSIRLPRNNEEAEAYIKIGQFWLDNKKEKMLNIIQKVAFDFDDVFIVPRNTHLTSRKDVDLNCKYTTTRGVVLEGIPIIAANMDTVGTLEASAALREMNCYTAIHKHYKPEELKEFYKKSDTNLSFFTFGICQIEDIKRVLEAVGFNMDDASNIEPRLNLDVANGYQQSFVRFVSKVRLAFPRAVIMAGNVVTHGGALALLEAGADIIKVGIGPGAQCETRKVTGVGYPQLSAIDECLSATNTYGSGLICSDGGCKTSGDVAKAFGAGAHFVMLGTMLAGHKENISNEEKEELRLIYLKDVCGFANIYEGKYLHDPNKIIPEQNLDEPYTFLVKTYGMSSETAMNKYSNGVADYKSSEGKTSTIQYRGTIKNTVSQILGGLRSTCTYVGSETLQNIKNRVQFIMQK